MMRVLLLLIGLIYFATAGHAQTSKVAKKITIKNEPKPEFGCDCEGDECGCCQHIEWSKIHLDDNVCLNITYNPQQLSISLTLEIGKDVIFNKTLSAKNPDFCVDVPFLHKLASLCIDFSNLTVSNSQFSGCVEIEAKLLDITVEKAKLGCFDIHVLVDQVKAQVLAMKKLGKLLEPAEAKAQQAAPRYSMEEMKKKMESLRR